MNCYAKLIWLANYSCRHICKSLENSSCLLNLDTYLRASIHLLQPQVDVVHRQKLIMLPTLRHSALKRVTIVQQDERLCL